MSWTLNRLGKFCSSVSRAFKKRILEWAENAFIFVLETIDLVLNIISSGVTEIIKKGKHYIKRMTVYVKNRQTQNYHKVYEEEYVNEDDIPFEILEELKQKEKAEMARLATTPMLSI